MFATSTASSSGYDLNSPTSDARLYDSDEEGDQRPRTPTNEIQMLGDPALYFLDDTIPSNSATNASVNNNKTAVPVTSVRPAHSTTHIPIINGKNAHYFPASDLVPGDLEDYWQRPSAAARNLNGLSEHNNSVNAAGGTNGRKSLGVLSPIKSKIFITILSAIALVLTLSVFLHFAVKLPLNRSELNVSAVPLGRINNNKRFLQATSDNACLIPIVGSLELGVQVFWSGHITFSKLLLKQSDDIIQSMTFDPVTVAFGESFEFNFSECDNDNEDSDDSNSSSSTVSNSLATFQLCTEEQSWGYIGSSTASLQVLGTFQFCREIENSMVG